MGLVSLMDIEFPARIKDMVAASTTAQLVAGTYSMVGSHTEQVPLPIPPGAGLNFGGGGQPVQRQYRQAQNNVMQFSAVEAGQAGPVAQHLVGSVNPATLGQGNHVVLMVVDIAPPRDIFNDFMRTMAFRKSEGWQVVGCWVPDGAAGRFTVENDSWFIKKWFGEGTGAAMKNLHMLKIVAIVIVGFIASFFVLSCFALLLLPVAFFAIYKMRNSAAEKGLVLYQDEEKTMLFDWATELMTQGKFQEEYKRSFPSAIAGGTVGGSDNSLL